MANQSAVAFTHLHDSSEAGTFIGTKIRGDLGGKEPDALILFASARYDHRRMLAAIHASCRPRQLVGCTSSGEFISGLHGEGSAVAIAIRSSAMRFSVGVGRGLRAGVEPVARELVSGFAISPSVAYPHRSVMVLTDALAGQMDQLIEELTVWTAGGHRIFGGAAGDDARFEKTFVFAGQEVLSDAAVGLEIHSKHPVGISLQHAWVPASEPMRVTSASGCVVKSLNAVPALTVMTEFAERTRQSFDPGAPMAFFLQNIVGIETSAGYKLRVPMSVGSDGSIVFAAEVPEGATVRLMGTRAGAGQDATAAAIESALSQLGEVRPGAALLFDCVATRLRCGQAYDSELSCMRRKLGGLPYAGLNTHGQVVRVEGQFSGFHNSSLLVCVLPE
jgi:hypothetical protein